MTEDKPEPVTREAQLVINADELLAVLVDLAIERPDYRYRPPDPGCVYTWDGQPSCIIGHAFARVGLAFPDYLELLDITRGTELGGTSISPSLVHLVAEHLGRSVSLPPDDDPVWQVLTTVQGLQDGGARWTTAVTAAFTEWNIPIPADLATARRTRVKEAP
jgi:hypothetical protein